MSGFLRRAEIYARFVAIVAPQEMNEASTVVKTVWSAQTGAVVTVLPQQVGAVVTVLPQQESAVVTVLPHQVRFFSVLLCGP